MLNRCANKKVRTILDYAFKVALPLRARGIEMPKVDLTDEQFDLVKEYCKRNIHPVNDKNELVMDKIIFRRKEKIINTIGEF